MYFSQGVHYSVAQQCIGAEIRIYDERVQICLEGYWNSLCGDNWGYKEALVVCTQLGMIGS